jgi:hypothetical protein
MSAKSEQFSQIAAAIYDADDFHGLDRPLVGVGLRFIKYQKMPLDQ